MLTIFTIPKPFAGESSVIQRNALRSWRALGEGIEILVLGDEAGAAEAAAEAGARHVPELPATELGTPLVSAAFERAAQVAVSPLLCYANADVLFLADLPRGLRRVRRRSLVCGRRWDLQVDRELDFEGQDAERRLRGEVAAHGRLHTEWGIDWFVFPRDIDWQMPPFAVGRPAWDNWLIWRARDLGLAVVDATRAITVVHQLHGYEHVPSGRSASWEGPEGDRNRLLMGGKQRRFNIFDATHVLTRRGLLPAWEPPYLKRRVRRRPRLARLVDSVRARKADS